LFRNHFGKIRNFPTWAIWLFPQSFLEAFVTKAYLIKGLSLPLTPQISYGKRSYFFVLKKK